MAKKKIFVIFTWNIHTVAGSQMYTAGKAIYMQKRGWQVHIFFNGSREGKSAIPSLTQYIPAGGGLNFLSRPPYTFKNYEQDFALREMLSRLRLVYGEEYEIILESHDDTYAYWAELFAEKIGARHFFVTCREIYRHILENNGHITIQGETYGDNLDFFYFKWKRNEVIGRGVAYEKLFNGYKNVTAPLVEMPWTVREMDAVQDAPFPIEKLARLDWNICHIGRAGKDYVPYVIEGVGELARRHPDKRINFIMVGNAASKHELLKRTFGKLKNVAVTLLGDMVPIPRILFSKVDVVCAISQSARFAANEDVLTIVGSAGKPSRTPGVLGYDTEQQVYGEGTFSYVEALENVLVKKLYADKKYSLPKLAPADEYYDKFWTIVKNASPVKEYYTARLSQERIRNWTAIFPFGTIARGSRIILFGETEITKDYRKQIESQQNSSAEFGRERITLLAPRPYCQIVATVDIHDDEFDNEIVGVERLKVKDYDAIVLCSYPPQAQEAYNKIRQVVPDMLNRVVYNVQALSV